MFKMLGIKQSEEDQIKQGLKEVKKKGTRSTDLWGEKWPDNSTVHQMYQDAQEQYTSAYDLWNVGRLCESISTFCEFDDTKKHMREIVLKYYRLAYDKDPKNQNIQYCLARRLLLNVDGSQNIEQENVVKARELFFKAEKEGHPMTNSILWQISSEQSGFFVEDWDKIITKSDIVNWLYDLAQQGDGVAQFRLGEYYQSFGDQSAENNQNAVYYFRLSAEQGYPNAQLELALCLLNGIGVELNEDEALFWLEQAARKIITESSLPKLSDFHLNETNLKPRANCSGVGFYDFNLVYLFLQASTRAKYQLGLFNLNLGTPASQEEAIKWFYLAAKEHGESGCCDYHTYAQYKIGHCLEHGIGVPVNKAEAMAFYLKAAKGRTVWRSFRNACVNRSLDSLVDVVNWYNKDKEYVFGSIEAKVALGHYHLSSIPPDEEEGIKWLTEAADENHLETQIFLAKCYETGTHVTEDQKRATEWYQNATWHLDADNYPNVQLTHGLRLLSGTGFEQPNPLEAVKFIRKAAEHSHSKAKYHLALCLLNGIGVVASPKEGITWLAEAAKEKVVDAQFQLGCFYSSGNHVPRVENEAIKLFRSAAQQGDKESERQLKILEDAFPQYKITDAEAAAPDRTVVEEFPVPNSLLEAVEEELAHQSRHPKPRAQTANGLTLQRIAQELKALKEEEASLQELPTPQARSQEKEALDVELKEVQQQLAAFKAKLAAYEGQSGAQNGELIQRVQALETQQQELLAIYKAKMEKHRAQQVFQQNPNLWLYYQTMRIRLEEFFIGCKAIGSEQIDTNRQGALGKIGVGINLLGQAISFVPFGVSALSVVTAVASNVLGAIDKQRQTNILTNISRLGTLGELKKAAEATARQLTEQYQRQLEALAVSSHGSANTTKQKLGAIKAKVKEVVLKEKSTAVAQDIAEFGVLKILQTLQDDKIKTDVPLERQFVAAVTVEPSKFESSTQKIAEALGQNKFMNSRDQTWSLQGFYSKPGIQAPDGTQYVGPAVDHQLYGFRNGTAEEARALGLTSKPKVVGASTPKGMSTAASVGSAASSANPDYDRLAVTLTMEMERRYRIEEELLALKREMKDKSGNSSSSSSSGAIGRPLPPKPSDYSRTSSPAAAAAAATATLGTARPTPPPRRASSASSSSSISPSSSPNLGMPLKPTMPPGMAAALSSRSSSPTSTTSTGSSAMTPHRLTGMSTATSSNSSTSDSPPAKPEKPSHFTAASKSTTTSPAVSPIPGSSPLPPPRTHLTTTARSTIVSTSPTRGSSPTMTPYRIASAAAAQNRGLNPTPPVNGRAVFPSPTPFRKVKQDE